MISVKKIKIHSLLPFVMILLFLLSGNSKAQNIVNKEPKATWIWYPGDYEIWLANRMQNRRTDRGTFFPIFWKMDSHYPLMEFQKAFYLENPEKIQIAVEGQYNVKLDGKLAEGSPTEMNIGKGSHILSIKVFNQANVPSIFVKGKTIVSDSSWLLTFEDKEWIDASGKVSDKSGTVYMKADYWNFDTPTELPSQFHLPTKPAYAKSREEKNHSLLLDFGKETFGFLKLCGLKGSGKVNIYYGESKEEALSADSCETLDRLSIHSNTKLDSVMKLSKAFRYVNIRWDKNLSLDSANMLYEYSNVKQRGSFRCSDTLINKIWNVAAYTLHLNTREFFIDGIKRDRWIWSGDAYQSYLMNYYLFFDSPTVERTIFALRGKDPVTSHINTIMDYTFYWFLSIHDFYQYTGNKRIIEQLYPRMKTLMDFCLSRRDKNGFMEGLPGDWIFIDWADGLSKKGAVSFEQLLFCRSLETMANCAKLLNDAVDAEMYSQLAATLKQKIFSVYWSPKYHALVHSAIDGQPTDVVNKYANMFALFFGYLSPQEKQDVKKYVLLNNKIPKITTPYMQFYELESLCDLGEQKYVLQQIKDYWGGMLKLGATTFWEQYDPTQKGAAIYSMYARPFGKSLCHAWGASPIYLLGKYYLGIKPIAPGYSKYLIQPSLGGLKWMEGTVPTPKGQIYLYCNETEMKVDASDGEGVLEFTSKKKPICQEGKIISKGNNNYEMEIVKGVNYKVFYQSR
ncbi:alpha-L-rhamnosidase-related protein [Arachidicoccus soli]|nr:alpha-L-rhamnosidase C-terminal domain-containing protein [Arachidicoccus soli]